MFDEPINAAAARVLLGAFAKWPKPGPDDELDDWTRLMLARYRWSSSEQAVLELAASLLGITDYEVAGYDPEGCPIVERRQVPTLRETLGACFDTERQLVVLAALELATVGPRPLQWRWLGRLG